MSDDRDEEVRRLRTAFMREAGLITGPPSASFARMLTFYGRDVAEMMYDAGARIPDPPRPRLPVVSDRAVECLYGHRGADLKDRLALAFRIILRETVAALPRTEHFGDTELGIKLMPSKWLMSEASLRDLVRTLTGEARP